MRLKLITCNTRSNDVVPLLSSEQKNAISSILKELSYKISKNHSPVKEHWYLSENLLQLTAKKILILTHKEEIFFH